MNTPGNQNPLVSICITFKNAEKYLHRVFESCFAQTYNNIEIVLVDDMSTDGSERIIKEYAWRDSRVRYFRNNKWCGVTQCLIQLFERAQGELVILLNTDDWMSRHYIETGVNDFLKYPDVAAVVPKIIALIEVGNDVFAFDREISYPSKAYSAEWFAREIYKGKLCTSVYALMRREDAVNLMNDFVKRWQESSVPDELKKMELEMAYSGDTTFLLDIFTRGKYKYFVFDNDFEYIKTSNPGQSRFVFRFDMAHGIFKFYYYAILNFKSMYKLDWKKFYSGMKIYFGSQALARSLVSLLRYGPLKFFSNIPEAKKQAALFFDDFSIFEIGASVFRSFFEVGDIIFQAIKRRTIKGGGKSDASRVFTPEYFLDKRGNFTVMY